MVKAYQHTADGYYAGEIEDYGVLPNNATHIAPTIKKGFVPHWTGEKWVQVEDHKGDQGYLNGDPYTIKEYGPLPEGWSKTPPPPTLAEARSTKIAEIKRGYDAALTASLTMPSVQNPPSAVEIALALDDFKAEDPEGWAFVRESLTARRDELLSQVAVAEATEDVLTIAVTYAV